MLSLGIFALVAGLLVFAKMNAGGFNVLWRYFAWANQTISVFAFAMIAIYMMRRGLPYLMALLPGMFYMFVITSFILNAAIGFHLPWTASYVIGGMLTLAYAGAVIRWGRKGARD